MKTDSLQSGSISTTEKPDVYVMGVTPAPEPLNWDGRDDPENPFNWPLKKRWYGTIVPGLLCLLV